MTPHELRDRIQLFLATGCGVPAGRDLAQIILRRLNRTLGPECADPSMAGDARRAGVPPLSLAKAEGGGK